MPTRPCLGLLGKPCGRLTRRPDSRCEDCARGREQARGSRHERGYDSTHVAIRERLLRDLKPGTPCPRCGTPMHAGQALDAGHSTPLRADRASRADRLECASCNRGARD